MILRLPLICALFSFSSALPMEISSVVETASGRILGKLNNWNGIKYYSYQGIPYAESPTGKLRFRPPVPRKPWKGVLNATEEGAICSQLTLIFHMNETIEDCLNVNVYVPVTGVDKLLPVMVFIHGGALQFSSGHTKNAFEPQFLLTQGIIFVTMNYRLGPFGFLNLGIPEASGNAALKDVLLSLKWVKQNIERFGGNPDMVTIAGHSSGSLICNYLMLTNQSNGLFNRAILLSGSAFTPRSYLKHPKEIAFWLAEEYGIKTRDVYKTLKAFQEADANDILIAYKNMSKGFDSPLRRYAPFVPSQEVKSDHALFSEDPMEMFRKSDRIPINIPVLVGITQQEAINKINSIQKNIDGVAKLRENPEYLIPSNIEYPIGSEASKNLSILICEKYFGGKDMKHYSLSKLIEFISDIQYVYGFHYWINKYKDMVNSKPIYLYIFDFVSDLYRPNYYLQSDIKGTGHGDDMPYMFMINSLNYGAIDDKGQRMIERMVKLISDFVYHGNPTPENLSREIQWPDYGTEQKYLLLNENPTVQKFSDSKFFTRMQFWDMIYNEYFDYLDSGGEVQKKIIP